MTLPNRARDRYRIVIRGECGPRQVEGARVALSHTVGRGANAGVVILTR